MPDIQLLFTGDLNQDTVTRLIDQVNQRVAAGARSLLLAMSTGGGNVYWGVTAYGFLRGLGLDEIVTHNMGSIESMGGPLYLTGDRRLCISHGRFLIHSVYWGFPEGASPSEKELADILLNLQRDRDRIATILSERTGTDLQDVRHHMQDTRILNAAEAIEYGFVHEISDDVFDPNQEIVTIAPW
jgi:ATP-dependent protease ClpP protease subunit